MQIPTNPFGKTGLEVTRLGLGLAALGRPGYINLGHGEDLYYDYVVEAMERRTHRMLDLAFEKGVRYFDVARSYGRAEQFLRSWLSKREWNPDEVVVGSKWGYRYTADWKIEAERHEIKEHSLEVLTRQWETSRALLPYLKLYQIHSATFESGVLENKAVLDYLAQMKQGGIRIGLSLSGVDQAEVLKAAREITIDGVQVFDTVQVTFNILEQSAAELLRESAEAGMGIIIKEALANGRLTTKNNNPDFEPLKKLLEELADRHEVGIDAIALAFILNQPWAHLVLSGAVVENHLESNLKAAHLKLEPGEVEALSEMRQTVEAYWNDRSQLQWN